MFRYCGNTIINKVECKKHIQLFSYINIINLIIKYMPKLKNVASFHEEQDHLISFLIPLHSYQYNYLLNNLKNNTIIDLVSTEMFANKLNDIPMRQIERLVERLVNEVKQIKLHYAIALPKNSKLIN